VRFSRKRQDGSATTLFQNLRENTCSLQPAMKSTAPGLESRLKNRLKNYSGSRITNYWFFFCKT